VPLDARRHVVLDSDGMADGWLYIVVEAPTNVFYHHQYGGFMCRQGRVEGYLVPVQSDGALEELRHIFEDEFGGAGIPYRGVTGELRTRLQGIVGRIQFWAADDGESGDWHRIRLDENRLIDLDEAWVPVLTPDGPGILLWPNSD
jgi:hypothetical protein